MDRHRPFAFTLSGVLAALLLWPAARVSAEEADPPAPSPAAEHSDRQAPRTPPARVTALRMADLAEDPSSFATVIEIEDYRGEEKTVADLLSNQVGVQVREFGGPGQFSELSIRGSTGAQVVVLLDGVRLNSAQTGSVDLSTLSLDLIERIEISRGGGAVQVGSAAVGGVVRITTRRATAEPQLAASAAVGSFGTQQGSFSYAGPGVNGRDAVLAYQGFHTKGDWDFQSVELRGGAGARLPSREFERINNESESHAGLLRLGRELAPGARLELSDQLYYASRGLPGLDTGRGDTGGQNAHAHQRSVRNVTAATVALDSIEAMPGAPSLDVRASHRWERNHFTDPVPDFGPPSDVVQRENASALSSELQSDFDFAGALHSVTLGAEGRRDALEDDEFGDPERVGLGTFLQYELAVLDDRIVVAPALRLDQTEGFGTEWIPRVGLIVSPWRWLRVKANYEKSYRVPNFGELYFPDSGDIRGNPNLEPEEAWNADAGVEFGIAEWGPLRQIRIEAVVFHNDIENSIVFQQVSPFTVQATNTGEAEVSGLELGGSIGVLGWLEVSGNWTHLDTDLKRDSADVFIDQGDGALPGRAKNETSLRVRVGPPSGVVKLVGEQHYTSKIPTSFSGNSFVSSRSVYDASAAIDVAQLGWLGSWHGRPEHLVVSVAAANLGDVSVRDALGFPQPGRSLTFQLEGRW